MNYKTINHNKILIGFLAFFLASGCSNKSDAPVEDQVVIRVDDRVLILSDFNNYFESIRIGCEQGQGQKSAAIHESRLVFLLQLAEEMIILRRADELRLDISPQELDAAVRDFQKDCSPEGFKDLFLKQAVSFESWKGMLKNRLLVEKVIHKELFKEVTITPKEIKDYYDKHWKERSRGEEIRVRQILLSSEDEAKKILKLIQKGEDFAVLARIHSIAPEAQDDGDMGYIAPGQLPECLEEPIFKIKQGAVSQVIKTPYGFHIFQALEKRETGKPKIENCIEEIKKKIQKERFENSYGPWLAGLRSRYKIEINKEII